MRTLYFLQNHLNTTPAKVCSVFAAVLTFLCLLLIATPSPALADAYWSEDGHYVIDWTYENAILYYDEDGKEVDDPSALLKDDGTMDFQIVVTLAPDHNSTSHGITLGDTAAQIEQEGTVEEWYDTVFYGQHKWREAKVRWDVHITGITADTCSVKVKVQDNFTVYCQDEFEVGGSGDADAGDEGTQNKSADSNDVSSEANNTAASGRAEEDAGDVHVTLDVTPSSSQKSKKASVKSDAPQVSVEKTSEDNGAAGVVYRLESKAQQEQGQSSFPWLPAAIAIIIFLALAAGIAHRLLRLRRNGPRK